MIKYLIIGLIQGFIEWIPVSSSGVILVLLMLMKVSPVEAYELSLLIHLGTLMSLIVALKGDFKLIFNQLIKFFKSGVLDYELKILIVASIATVITGLPSYLIFKYIVGGQGIFQVKLLVGVLLFITAMASLVLSSRSVSRRIVDEKCALLLGLLQGLSAIPGLSRSGLTITGLLVLGVSSDLAFKWSYIASAPPITGLTLVELLTGSVKISIEFLLALFSAFISGLFSIKFMIEVSKRVERFKLMIVVAFLIMVSALIDLIT